MIIALQGSKVLRLDLRLVKEVHTLDFKLRRIKIGDKWEKDREIKQFDAARILILSYATSFNLRYWILLCEYLHFTVAFKYLSHCEMVS